MSMGEYYGRQDYTCDKPDDRNAFTSLLELLTMLGDNIMNIFKKPGNRSRFTRIKIPN